MTDELAEITSRVALPVTPPWEAVILLAPPETPAALPEAVMVATALFELAQLTLDVISQVSPSL